MLTHPMLDQLHQLGLSGMAQAFAELETAHGGLSRLHRMGPCEGTCCRFHSDPKRPFACAQGAFWVRVKHDGYARRAAQSRMLRHSASWTEQCDKDDEPQRRPMAAVIVPRQDHRQAPAVAQPP